MADIRFYHVTTQALDQAMFTILTKAAGMGKRCVVVCRDKTDMATFDEMLWTARADSFLPHGTAQDPHPDHQPVYLTLDSGDNPAAAEMLALKDIYPVPEKTDGYTMICDFIDGRSEESVQAGRERWKAYKTMGHTLTYWQQSDTGAWEQKA